MRRINLDRKDERIKKFVRSLAAKADGSILEMNGEPVLRVTPVEEKSVDQRKLKAAILRCREASRSLNAEWEEVDRE
jgi:hypothetical protein